MSVDNDATTIYPTGTCFTDALEMLETVAREQPLEIDRYTLVHAICIMPGQNNLAAAGERYAHAWLDKFTPHGTEAWQRGIWCGHLVEFVVASIELERELRPQRMWRYSPRMALEQNREHHNFGPWEPELLALCGRHVCRIDEALR